MYWFKLIRWKNLAIIFLTQFLAWYCVILPEEPVFLNLISFLLLSFSTVLIAAAGYIINDYFDIKIDSINRPEKVLLGNRISPKLAIIIHTALNILALIIAIYIAYTERNMRLILLQLFCTILLWFYSTKFKKNYIIGNIVVSLLTALTIIALIVYEPKMIEIAAKPFFITDKSKSSLPFWVLLVYSYFAFILNWMREIVKDMEDFIGDEREGCNTMPIKKGLKFSVCFILLLACLAIIPLFTACWFLFRHHNYFFLIYVFFVLVLPVIGWCIYLVNDYTTQHYKQMSKWLKIIMVFGIVSLIIYYLQI